MTDSTPITPVTPESLDFPPVITITPATLPYDLPPFIDLAMAERADKPCSPPESDADTINLIDGSYTPDTAPSTNLKQTPLFPLKRYPSSHPTKIQRPCPPPSPPIPSTQTDGLHSLLIPLHSHLSFLHPSTPPDILAFVATRLLSPDRPYGHAGTWNPVHHGIGDLSTAGLGLDVGCGGCKRLEGSKGQVVDGELEWMYGVARRSWGLLEEMGPGTAKI